ncbi:hypothetical protein [Nitrospirillum amazonense]|uniref:hypothetical protein n=1 Tax=Nitrospirillum amazonense TaxID=28077 RepID=UPI0016493019|nr:hypothetical protein [Nitrospirillum amazonense]
MTTPRKPTCWADVRLALRMTWAVVEIFLSPAVLLIFASRRRPHAETNEEETQ